MKHTLKVLKFEIKHCHLLKAYTYIYKPNYFYYKVNISTAGVIQCGYLSSYKVTILHVLSVPWCSSCLV